MFRSAISRTSPGIILGVFLLTLASARAQNWVATTAPAVGWTSLAASQNGSRLVAVSSVGGIYLSTNSAKSWKLTTAPDMPWTSVASAANGTRWIASANGGIYLSANSGVTWKNAGAPGNAWNSVASSADGQTLAGAVANGGIYISPDSGSTWNQSHAPVKPWSALAMTADASLMVAACEPGFVYTSTNFGLDWTSNTAPGLSWSGLAASADGSKLFAAATMGGIFSSTNGGLSWNKTSATNDSWFSIACSADGSKLLATALHSGLYLSTNAGQTWTKTQAPGWGWLSAAMSADGSSLYAAAFDVGIFVPGSASGLSLTNATYQGLFYDTNGVAVESSGFASISVRPTGAFSARLQFVGQSHSLSGNFSASGFSSNSIPGTNPSPVTVLMRVDPLNNNRITGQISNDTWSAELTAYASSAFSKTNPCPQAGQYTLAFPGTDTPDIEPAGDGYATIAVSSLGSTSLSGKLADGTPVAEKASIQQNGLFPLFESLYSGKGLLLGWVDFSNQPQSDVSGLLTWIAPSSAGQQINPAGFTNQLQATGSRYQFNPANPILNMTTGMVSFAYGNLPQSFTNQIRLTTNNTIANLSSNQLSCKITTSSGQFSGSVTIPGTKQTVSFVGVLLQKQNMATGFFLGTNQSGSVLLGPQP